MGGRLADGLLPVITGSEWCLQLHVQPRYAFGNACFERLVLKFTKIKRSHPIALTEPGAGRQSVIPKTPVHPWATHKTRGKHSWASFLQSFIRQIEAGGMRGKASQHKPALVPKTTAKRQLPYPLPPTKPLEGA